MEHATDFSRARGIVRGAFLSVYPLVGFVFTSGTMSEQHIARSSDTQDAALTCIIDDVSTETVFGPL